jgi:hypothetical protein
MTDMKAIGTFAIVALVFGSVPGLAFATAPQPLRLELPARSSAAAPAARPSAFERSMATRPARIAPLFQRGNPGAGARQPVARTELQGRARDLGRQALHASTLSFDHPVTGARLSFEVLLPEDMQRALTALS